jgi:hypothetical protein
MQRHGFPLPPAEGQTVVLADGDEVGTVEAVVEPPDSQQAPLIVVHVDTATLPQDADHLYIPQHAVHLVTEHDVVLGTTAAWLAQHAVTEPPTVG